MEKVIVLMSTYNGEKYLSQQIESVLSQIDVDIQIFVRDDGSSDSTQCILEKYKSLYEKFDYYVGNNLGAAWSFVDLVKKAPYSNFYAFCDQDDVWDENKVRVAVSSIRYINNERPAMYYSNLYVTDESLNVIRKFLPDDYCKENKYNAIIDNMAAGCSIVFNHKARQYFERLTPGCQSYILMHDAWMHLICSFFGVVVYDNDSYLYYRQHGNNTVGTNENKTFSLIIHEKVVRLLDKSVEPRRLLATNFYNTYLDLLDEKDCIKLNKIINYKKSLKNRLMLLVDKSIRAPNAIRDFRYRLLILRGLA